MTVFNNWLLKFLKIQQPALVSLHRHFRHAPAPGWLGKLLAGPNQGVRRLGSSIRLDYCISDQPRNHKISRRLDSGGTETEEQGRPKCLWDWVELGCSLLQYAQICRKGQHSLWPFLTSSMASVSFGGQRFPFVYEREFKRPHFLLA